MVSRIKHVVLLRDGTKHRSISAALGYVRSGGQGSVPFLHGIGAKVSYTDGRIVDRRFCDPRLLPRVQS